MLSNLLFWLIWIGVEIHRRHLGRMPEMPLALLLVLLSINTLLVDFNTLFRIGAFVALLVAVYEAREFIRLGAPEASLVGALVSAGFGTVVLTWWAVVYINEHLNLAIG
jgi:hypothetical protein